MAAALEVAVAALVVAVAQWQRWQWLRRVRQGLAVDRFAAAAICGGRRQIEPNRNGATKREQNSKL